MASNVAFSLSPFSCVRARESLTFSFFLSVDSRVSDAEIIVFADLIRIIVRMHDVKVDKRRTLRPTIEQQLLRRRRRRRRHRAITPDGFAMTSSTHRRWIRANGSMLRSSALPAE